MVNSVLENPRVLGSIPRLATRYPFADVRELQKNPLTMRVFLFPLSVVIRSHPYESTPNWGYIWG